MVYGERGIQKRAKRQRVHENERSVAHMLIARDRNGDLDFAIMIMILMVHY